MICFGILSHEKPLKVLSNISLYYSSKHFYIIHVDRKSLPPWKSRCLPENIIIISTKFVSWASISIVDATVDIIKRAFEVPGWSHFCLLSGQDIPNYPLTQLEQKICNTPSIISVWNQLNSFYNDPICTEENVWGSSVNQGEAPKLFLGRFTDVVVDPELRVSNSNHLGQWRIRYSYEVESISNTMCISNLSAMQMHAFKEWFNSGKELFIGSAWFSLERNLMEYCMNCDLIIDLYQLCRNMLFPDECFFLSLIGNALDRQIMQNSWGITYYSHDNNGFLDGNKLSMALERKLPFARKYNFRSFVDAKLESHLEKIYAENILAERNEFYPLFACIGKYACDSRKHLGS